MKKDLRRLVQIVLVLFLVIGALWVNRKNRLMVENSGYRVIMGTFAQVTIGIRDEAEARDLFRMAFAEMERIQKMMNDRDPDSEISRLSEIAVDKPVEVSPELFDVLWASVETSRLTEGAFDITVGPEVRLWRRMQQEGRPPTPEELAAARSRVGWEKLILDPEKRTVQLAVEGMHLDVGAIAKGYTVDLVAKALVDAQVPTGMVDIGGNIRCFGTIPDYPEGWVIGLQDPRNEEERMAKLSLRDMSVATSGDYRRFAQVEGQKQSHILDPRSGQSVRDLISVTILAPTAMRADALSTAVSVMGFEKGMALIESLEDVEAIVVTSEEPGQFISTVGADQYIIAPD